MVSGIFFLKPGHFHKNNLNFSKNNIYIQAGQVYYKDILKSELLLHATLVTAAVQQNRQISWRKHRKSTPLAFSCPGILP